jgi:hypothetical protein
MDLMRLPGTIGKLRTMLFSVEHALAYIKRNGMCLKCERIPISRVTTHSCSKRILASPQARYNSVPKSQSRKRGSASQIAYMDLPNILICTYPPNVTIPKFNTLHKCARPLDYPPPPFNHSSPVQIHTNSHRPVPTHSPRIVSWQIQICPMSIRFVASRTLNVWNRGSSVNGYKWGVISP